MKNIWEHIIKLKYGDKIIYEKNSYSKEKSDKYSNRTNTDCGILRKEVLNNARKR